MNEFWNLPDLKQAKARRKQEVMVDYSFSLPEETIGLGNHKKFYLRTYGCQANIRDGETIAGLFVAMGFEETDVLEQADVILLNTCAIRENAENKVFGEIGNLKHLKVKNPDLIMGVCGCMAQEESVINRILAKHPHIDLIFGTHNIHRLPHLLHHTMFTKEKTIEVYSKEGDIIENLPDHRFGEVKAWVNIMYGCDKFCTYCIVPYTRGKERSRSMEDILAEVVHLKNTGFKEITLLGQNVNAYGKDLGIDDGFATLLEAVAKTNISRVRFTTSHPWDFTPNMIHVIANYDNIMPAIHLPMQSGNNDVLKRMGRRYTIEQYKKLFDDLKVAIANCSFSTDIIVGFPNESDEHFQQTMDMVDYCQFDQVYSFIYSPRASTPAADFDDTIDMETKKARLAKLNEKIKHYAFVNNQKYLNEVVEVLVDGRSKKDKDIFSGYTPQNKLVNFKGKDIETGQLVSVRVTEAKSWFLLGEAL
jgi:tRNA-2-methylthio-N6-dimethylallyladenosine synthase